MQYDPFVQRSNQGLHYVEDSYQAQDTEAIKQMRRERQPMLIITVISPELHFDAAVGLCVEGSISEVCDVR